MRRISGGFMTLATLSALWMTACCAIEPNEEQEQNLLNQVDNEDGSPNYNDDTVTSYEETGCIGCSRLVNPSTAAMRELALLGLRYLDRHQPHVRHHLNSVLQALRNDQVPNKVRYELTLEVNYHNCSSSEIYRCNSSKICKVSAEEKSGDKLNNTFKLQTVLHSKCFDEKTLKINIHKNAYIKNNIIKRSIPVGQTYRPGLTPLDQLNIPLLDLTKYDPSKVIVDGISIRDPNDPKFIDLAQKTLLLYKTASAYKDVLLYYQLMKINRVTTQLVTGMMTVMNFTIMAPFYSSKFPVHVCDAKITEPTRTQMSFLVDCDM